MTTRIARGLSLPLLSVFLMSAAPPARIAVWDTVKPSAGAYSPDVIAARPGWVRIARGQTPETFQGDAVLTNGPILLVARQAGGAVELYAAGPRGAASRTRLRLAASGGDPSAGPMRAALVESTRGAAALEVSCRTRAGAAVKARFRIRRGEISVEAAPGAGAGLLRVECPGRFLVLPDFFADDILIDARATGPASIEVPSENFLLHPIAGGDSIVMCVFENSDQEVKATLSGAGDQRKVTGSEIHFGKEGKIWVALLEAPGVWHTRNLEPGDAGKIIPLPWKAPFVAQWRVDFTRRNGLTDSWEMLLPDTKGGGYLKPSWLPATPQGNPPSRTATGEIDRDAYKSGAPVSDRLGADRKRWTTVLGRVQYPFWSDRGGRGYLQPLKHRKMAFEGPLLIYPINRLAKTPIDTYTTVDVVRNTLGVGPCQYILDVESQKEEHVGRATCHVRRLLNEIYGSKQQKTKRKEIGTYLDDGLAFVSHIRGRIDQYVEFGHEIRKYIAAQRKQHPELKSFLDEMESIAAQLDERMEARRERIKTPAYVAQLNDDFRKRLLTYDGPDAMQKLKTYTDALTRLGGSQDELVGECRWTVRALRQRAGILMAADPRCAPIAEEIRERARKVLRKPAAYEAPRH